MNLKDLVVIHQNKRPGVGPLQVTSSAIFELETCLRHLWISAASEFNLSGPTDHLDVFKGEKAYEFLLLVSTGLQSRIPGETEIFGQLKEGWRSYQSQLSDKGEPKSVLTDVMNRLFEDTKDVRARYLQNLGGTSYGSLVRKLLENGDLAPSIVLVGAGQLAQNVAPWLEKSQLTLCNRSAARAVDLQGTLKFETKFLPMDQLTLPTENQGSVFEHWVLCVPFQAEMDQLRLSRWITSGSNGYFVHLGARREELVTILADLNLSANDLKKVVTLDDLFGLLQSDHDLRTLQIRKANEACVHHAKRRASPGGMGSAGHGWEDLVEFA